MYYIFLIVAKNFTYVLRTCLQQEAYARLPRTSNMESFATIATKRCLLFHETLNLRCLQGSWMHFWQLTQRLFNIQFRSFTHLELVVEEKGGHQTPFLRKEKERKNKKIKFLRHSFFFLFLSIPASLSPNKSHTVIQQEFDRATLLQNTWWHLLFYRNINFKRNYTSLIWFIYST